MCARWPGSWPCSTRARLAPPRLTTRAVAVRCSGAGMTTSRRRRRCLSASRSGNHRRDRAAGPGIHGWPRALFEPRINEGRIVAGHGNLLADEIYCLDDGPRILDCLDFDDKLHWLDGLDDAAFLMMDLERLKAPALARQFADWYAEYSGDHPPASLRRHYVAYRAFVRAKAACIKAGQGRCRGGIRGPAAGQCRVQAASPLRPGTIALAIRHDLQRSPGRREGAVPPSRPAATSAGSSATPADLPGHGQVDGEDSDEQPAQQRDPDQSPPDPGAGERGRTPPAN